MIRKIIKAIKNPYKIFVHLACKGYFNSMSDEKYLRNMYRGTVGKRLNLGDPQTFNEKLQWLKLYDRKPEYTMMVDKYAVKEYVSCRIGSEYIIPTLGIWDNFDDIDFASLPNQFVLKCTHDSGGIVICKNKGAFDIKQAKKKMEESLKRDYYLYGREWPYKNVPRKIIAEQYMEDTETSELRDYKFFCFGGKVKALFIATERQSVNEETKFDFFDENYCHLPITNGHPNAKIIPEKPYNFEKMKVLAEKLSENIPHLRVDFYEVNGKIYFGELTFFQNSGFVPFEPTEWDLKFGEWIILPEKSTE